MFGTIYSMDSPVKNKLAAASASEPTRSALKQFYQTSESYAEHLEKETEAYFTRYLRLIETYARGAETVLDAGCGTGLSSYMLSLRKRRVIGVDLSELFLCRGLAYQRSPNLLRAAGDMIHLPLKSEMFDLVASYLVISFIPDIPQALSEIVRVLKPGGLVLIVTPNQTSPLWPLRDFWGMLRGGPARPIFCETPLGALKTAWSNAVFSIQKALNPGLEFSYIKPDLTCSKVVGGESDAVYRSSPIDFIRFFKKEGFEILRVGSKNSWMEKLFPVWAGSIEFIARKR